MVKRRDGFTLVEILIVVIILGFLASIVIPKFSNATQEARHNMLRENLRMLRTQINTYKVQHWDVPPGYDNAGNPSEATFIAQMTMFSDEQGNTSDVGGANFPYGPYLKAVPENSLNNLSTIRIIADGAAMPDAAADTHGWIFKPEEMIMRADSTGTDVNNVTLYSY